MNCGFTYFIRDKTNKNLIYYGSSCEPTLDDRIYKHIKCFDSWKNTGNGYCSSYKILEKDNYEYGIIEIVYFDTKQELREYERPLIEGQVCVNIQVPNRSSTEYREANKEHIKEQHADYYQNNKEKLKEQHADYYQNNKEKFKEQHADYYQENKEHIKECVAEYREANKDKIKEYKAEWCKANKEHIKEQNAKWYEANKDKVKIKHAEYHQANKDKINKKFNCECGGKYTHTSKARHLKTNKHQKWLCQTIA